MSYFDFLRGKVLKHMMKNNYFCSAVQVSFLQRSAASTSARRSSAARLVAKASKRLNSKTLDAVSALMQVGGPFDKVIKIVDENIATIQEEMASEVKHRDHCTKSLNTNSLDTQTQSNKKTVADEKADAMSAAVEENQGDIKDKQSKIQAIMLEMKELSASREEENGDFQGVVSEGRATVDILQKVMTRLQDTFGKSFVQQHQPEFESDYKQNSGSGGILMLIGKIVTDQQKVIDQGTILTCNTTQIWKRRKNVIKSELF